MNFNALIPELSVSDIQISKDFYINTLGFTLEYERIEDSFAFISLGGAQLMLEQYNGCWNTGELTFPFGRGINFQISVQNIQTIIDKLEKQNIALFKELFVSKYKVKKGILIEKEILLQDPDGYLLRFSETMYE